MTPQSAFMVVAPVAAGREAALRELLARMNREPGVVDPHNPVLPFGRFDCLHFARLVLVDDATMADLERFGLPRPRLPLYLVLLGECDGEADALLRELAQHAAPGLRQLFAHCEGFDAGTDLLAWLLAHATPTTASYVNRVGRTVKQVREEAALARALATQVSTPTPQGTSAMQRRTALKTFVDAQLREGRLTLTPEAPTPLGWQLRNLLHLLGVPLLGLIAFPFLLVLSPLFILVLRRHEKSDPEYCPRPAAVAVLAMQELEDHDLTNSFTAVGPVKPGAFRYGLLWVLLVAIDYASRHVFTRGHLGRVQTIHFARWTWLDGGARVLFASNYDGSHEAYMDDFINKVAWGLNLSFSNGFGWPRTDWLIKGGARHELRFKHYQRRHQVPTQVWFKAYPGLTLSDLERNRRIRQGLEAATLGEAEALAWLSLL
ncbi:hypothetical protein [Niveibacterium sp. SC-1]|uniref:hypothetical protein n=1 Tax=Niveibacterium sp. SC-1 TaxID=3135646 RepID=UPI00311DEE8E